MSYYEDLKNSSSSAENDFYYGGLSKSRGNFATKLKHLATGFKGVDDEFIEELMVILLGADIGIETSEKIVDEVKKLAEKRRINDANSLRDVLVEVMHKMYSSVRDIPLKFNKDNPTVILMVGVNGSGKTTSCAKIAYSYKNRDRKVLLVAADTFRAGAIEQLKTWADRLEIPCVAGKHNADPASVLVDGCRYAKENDIQVVLADTAGRLQNKVNLMKELEKMHKVISREIPGEPRGVWLVIDATTGQNGISQAKEFMQVTKVNGIILTKLDGSAKGGIVMAIRDILGLPVKYVGLGESMEDLRKFDINAYLYGLCAGIGDE